MNDSKKNIPLIAGTDEAGRGCLAGPVVIGAAVLQPTDWPFWIDKGIKDSKKLSLKKREELFELLTNHPRVTYSLAQKSPQEIDRFNILKSTLLAFQEAAVLLHQKRPFQYLLIDGNKNIQNSPEGSQSFCLIGGDDRSLSIAAASIIAKVSRDRLMAKFDENYPGYDFAKNKGYPSKSHRAAIEKLGDCPIHRKTYQLLKKPSQGRLF